MTIEESRDQISLVAMNFADIAVTSEVTEHRLGNFGVGVRRKSPSQHGGSNRQIEQTQPAMHGRQSFEHAVIALQRDRLKPGRDRDFSTDKLLQELLIEALDSRQNSQLPLRILYHSQSLQRTNPYGFRGGPRFSKN